MKNIKLVILLLFCGNMVFAQKNLQKIGNEARVIYTIKDLSLGSNENNIADVRHNKRDAKLVATTKEGKYKIISDDSVWGYESVGRYSDHIATRLSDRTYYHLIRYDSTIFIYLTNHRNYDTFQMTPAGYYSGYVFSTSFNGKLYSFTKQNLLQQGGEVLLTHVKSDKKMRKWLKRRIRLLP